MAEIKSINNMPLCDKAAREDIEKITSEINTLVTKDELDEAIAEIDETILGIDVSTYATKDELDNKQLFEIPIKEKIPERGLGIVLPKNTITSFATQKLIELIRKN